MGTTGTMWRNDWTKSGNYTYSARLTQMRKASHPVSYGLVIGGSNMGPSPTYTYFLVRQAGEYFISNWEGASPTTVVGSDPERRHRKGRRGRETVEYAVRTGSGR